MQEMQSEKDWEAMMESDVPIILQASADWCGPCRMLKPMMKTASADFEGKVQYVLMDVDKFPQIS